jgi:hypothetical protein
MIEEATKPLKPGTRGLFETINGLMEVTNMCGIRFVMKARRLLHINLFRKNAMKEGIFDIELANSPLMSKS